MQPKHVVVLFLSSLYLILLIGSGVWIMLSSTESFFETSSSSPVVATPCYDPGTYTGTDSYTAGRMFEYVPLYKEDKGDDDDCFLYLSPADKKGCPTFEGATGTLKGSDVIHAGVRPMHANGGKDESICTYKRTTTNGSPNPVPPNGPITPISPDVSITPSPASPSPQGGTPGGTPGEEDDNDDWNNQ